MRVLIVDDEPIARRVLREELEDFPGVTAIAEASDGIAALREIREHSPDLVFLDLQMPAMDGLSVLGNLKGEPMPAIVVVTAYDHHAIQALDAGAVDYLLKPVHPDRLHAALDRATRLLPSQSRTQKQDAAAPPRHIVGKLGSEYFLLRPEEVFAFQAEGETVWIVTARQRFHAMVTLKALEERLRGHGFQRVHRNALVNVAHVRKMASLSSHRWLLTLRNSLELVVSKRQAQAVREALHR
jgi:DNA-binding LytR/AlgR family response regulator